MKSVTRDILYYNGTVMVSGFSYNGYVARLITYQELKSVCANSTSNLFGISSNCEFLYENTQFANSSNIIKGIWTDTVYSSDSAIVVAPYYNGLTAMSFSSSSSPYSARPVIEVSKEDISY